jgi:hypothetical protein
VNPEEIDLTEILNREIWKYIEKRTKPLDDHIIWNRRLMCPRIRILYYPRGENKKRELTFESVLRYEFDIPSSHRVDRMCEYNFCVNPEHYIISDKGDVRRKYYRGYYDKNVKTRFPNGMKEYKRKGVSICRLGNIPNYDAESIRYRPVIFDKKTGVPIVIEPKKNYLEALRIVAKYRGDDEEVIEKVKLCRKEHNNFVTSRMRRLRNG